MSDSDGSLSDGKKAAAAAGDLLQLAAAANAVSSATPAGGGAGGGRKQPTTRARDAKPYQRRGGGAAGKRGREDESWLPGGLWWKNKSTPMPSGRQPGELAGWQPLAGEGTQQRLQEQKEALHLKEQLVRGLDSRDDAAAYLQQLGHMGTVGSPGGPRLAEGITSSVDDSAIERSSAFKQLASWGGFRRQFVEGVPEGTAEQQKDQPPPTGQPPAAASSSGGAADGGEAWRQHLHEQLLAKRAEVLATQKKLESLSLEQQELEMLYTTQRGGGPNNPP